MQSVHDLSVDRYRAAPEEQLLKAFQVLDADSKGYLTQDEITKAMTEEGELMRV